MSDDVQAQIAALSAQADQAQATGDHANRIAAATQALDLMKTQYRAEPSAAPTNAAEAAARLQHLEKSAYFREKFFSGDSKARAEFASLTEQLSKEDDVSRAMSGALPLSHEIQYGTGDQAGIREMASAARDWYEADEVTAEDEAQVAHFLRDGKYDQAQYELARQIQSELLADPKFMEKLKSGDPFTVKLWRRCGMVLAAGVDPALPDNSSALRLLYERGASRYRGGKIT